MLNYITKKLENGVKCYIVPKKGYAEKKAMIAFNYGSCNTEFIYNGKTIKQTKGTAHFLEHKMFDGSADIFSEFEKLGASANAFTNFTTTAYHFNCTENFEKAFELLMKMVSSLDTTEESVEREKKIIGQEIKMYNDDIGWQVYFNGLKCAYSDNNVRYSVAGTLESIDDINCEDLYNAYKEQVEGLVDGGVDIILFETTFDTLNVKAGLEAAEVVLKEKEKDLPIMLSLTLSAQGGRTFSGQTLLAFLASIQHTHIVSVGLNCSFGAADMKPYLQELAKYAPYYISAYPNAGLPNSFGTYDETPDKMAQHVKPFVEEGLVNIIGGCCGTTPAHISRYPELVKGAKPHIPAPKPDCLWLSGLELLEVKPENNFVNVGERL